MELELITIPTSQSQGRGEILFIHGVYHGAWCWENFMPYFADRGFTAHAMSLRGHGESAGKESVARASFDDYLEDVAVTVARFDRPPILIGHSLGGMLVQKYIEQHPVPAAALLSTPTPKAMREAAPRLMRHWPMKMMRFLITRNPDYLHHDPQVLKTLYFSTDLVDDQVEQHLRRLLAQHESRRIYSELSFLRFNRPRTWFPVRVIGGGKDFTLAPTHFKDTAALYDTEPSLYADKPHDLMLVDGWQAVADDILDWLIRLGI